MSQVVTRAGAAGDDRKSTDSPVKDMKKKMAANAEKEKTSTDKPSEKHAEKQADKQTDKNVEKHAEKQPEKHKHVEKQTEKQPEKHKHAEKQPEKHKHAEKQQGVKPVEKIADKGAASPADAKGDKHSKDAKTADSKPQQNGDQAPAGAVGAVSNGDQRNGAKDPAVIAVVDDYDEEVVIDMERDELFPELAYDDQSDNEDLDPLYEGGGGGAGAGRSVTRRSQVKSTRTPETPRPASQKQTDKDTKVNGDDIVNDNSKECRVKLLKLKDDPPTSDRKLRSSDRSTPDPKDGKAAEDETRGQDSVVVVVEVADEGDADQGGQAEGARRKTDTNYAKSRVKVSPYRRGARLADQTATSTAANYTGNNTTMEMDLTETSSFMDRPSTSEDPSALEDTSYVGGLRNIRGRRSYKQLKELSLKDLALNRSRRDAAKGDLSGTDAGRPTGHVVGRKRRPADEEPADAAASAVVVREAPAAVGPKRMRLVERVLSPFVRRSVASSTPLPARRAAAPIVGINTDLPLSAPVASAELYDPETLKQSPSAEPLGDATGKQRCAIQ